MRVFWVVVAACAVIGFQNCTGPDASNRSAKSLAKGGDGYTGKVVYVHLSKDQVCPDGSREKSAIEFSGSEALLVKENCAPVQPPRLMPNAYFMPYNPGIVMVGPQLFERRDVGQFSEFACRGKATLPDPFGRIGFADVQLRDTGVEFMGSKIYNGVVVVGYFDTAGNLMASQTRVIDRAELAYLPPDPTIKVYRLYHPDPAALPSMLTVRPQDATFAYHSSSMTEPILVPQMSCSFHE